MPKFNEENERIKHQYLAYLREAKGQDESSLDKAAAALRDFEEALGYKTFKAFHRGWASTYKKHLAKRRNVKSGKPLGVTTRDATLRHVKAFIDWLSSQPGYRSRISRSDVLYFNNNAREARAAHARREIPYPSLEQCGHAFRKMQEATEVQRRDKAIFAFLMLTGARDSATASLRHKHVDLIEGVVHQDGREVRTKGGKSFDTWFFPVEAMYRAYFEAWVEAQRTQYLFGPGDALFPKVALGKRDGRFASEGLSRETYTNGQPINAVIKGAFRAVNLHEYTAHSFRKTLAMLGDKVCSTLTEHKAWSQNLGHEHLATTVSAYMPVPPEHQAELIRGL